MKRYRSLPELADLLDAAAAAGRIPRLSGETALVVAAALRAYSTHPSREDVARAICLSKGKCSVQAIRTCWTCLGKANEVIALYQGTPYRNCE